VGCVSHRGFHHREADRVKLPDPTDLRTNIFGLFRHFGSLLFYQEATKSHEIIRYVRGDHLILYGGVYKYIYNGTSLNVEF
jgi:hypothetical protein